MGKPLDGLIAHCRESQSLRSTIMLLQWDQETLMPRQGAEGRGRAMAALSRELHRRDADPRYADLLERCAEEAPPDSEARAMVSELRRQRERSLKVPEALVAEFAGTAAVSERAWAEAKAKDDLTLFMPWLEKMVDLRRREAECLGYAESPYDALLEDFETGLRASTLKVLFESLRGELVPLLERILEGGGRGAESLAGKRFPVEAQREFCAGIVAGMGFDLSAGRIDPVAAHGIMAAVDPGDVRITMRFLEDNLAIGLFGVIHEAGHGLYEQGFEDRWLGTPLAEAASTAMHESQSRLWENNVGRSRDFWMGRYPALQRAFPAQLGGTGLEDFLGSVNRVRRSPIRTEADEVTYNLHIVVRFELEAELFGGNLAVRDVEGAWNESMRRNLGITPRSAAEGVLQDVHWSAGQFGYFPSYTLGNLRAAQLFAAAERALPDLGGGIRAGRLAPLRDWLRENVHRHGSRYPAEELMRRATGETTRSAPFLAYLRGKYLA